MPSMDPDLYDDDSIFHCTGCGEPILDRFVHKVLERPWHSKCLRCEDCGLQLAGKCFSKGTSVYCKEDFLRRFGTKCDSCGVMIPPSSEIIRTDTTAYHPRCFACKICKIDLDPEGQFYLADDRKLLCKYDFDATKQPVITSTTPTTGHNSDDDAEKVKKGSRTNLTPAQFDVLKRTYENTPKPTRQQREDLTKTTGLEMRVIQVWFQNRRAKEKRVKKDGKVRDEPQDIDEGGDEETMDSTGTNDQMQTQKRPGDSFADVAETIASMC